jgi:hypothetical protein
MSNIDATKSPVHHWESENFLVNPPGIPYSSHRDLDLFIDAAESAENRWRDKLAELQKRIAGGGLTGADEVGPELFRRSMKAIEQLNHLWHCLWLHRCLKRPVGPNNPTQLARWCRFRRRLLPHSPGVDSFDWRTGQRVFQETAAAILRAWQTPALWTNFPDLLDAPKKSPTKNPAANEGESVEARLVRITWEYLRGVARGLPIPSEPANVTTQAETRAALDLVENWCKADKDDRRRNSPAGIAADDGTRTALLLRAISLLGKDADVASVIEKAGVGNQKGLSLLRDLESRGEFSGFKRKPPANRRQN